MTDRLMSIPYVFAILLHVINTRNRNKKKRNKRAN